MNKDLAVSLIGAASTVITAVLGYLSTRRGRGGWLATTEGSARFPTARSRTSALAIALVAVVATLVGGGAAYAGVRLIPEGTGSNHLTSTTPPAAPTKVPKLIGLDRAHAMTALAQAGLDSDFRDVDATAPKDQVVSVTPAEGSSIGRGGKVTVQLSRGPGCPTGIVKIRSAPSGKILKLPNNAATPAVIVQDADSGTGTDKSEQWHFDAVGAGWFAIISVSSGLAISVNVPVTGPADHAPVQTFYPRSSDNQLWQCVLDGTGYQLATRLSPTFVIDVPGGNPGNGVPMQIYTSAPDKLNQRWQFVPVG